MKWGARRRVACAVALRDLWHFGQSVKNASAVQTEWLGTGPQSDGPRLCLPYVLAGHKAVPSTASSNQPSAAGISLFPFGPE